MAETTERVLRLLGLFETRSVWTGSELTEVLGVTTRTLRRDVMRLRDLGYPVEATPGVGGGYRLGAGGRMPPLLLEEDEVVAVTVALRVGAQGIAAIGEPAVRALTKLDQVMPPRLRGEVAALADATALLPGATDDVDTAVLVVLAHAIRDHVRARFAYTGRTGDVTERDVEPYRLVATGRRWYLLAWDGRREDWRTFRLDRMAGVRASTFRFTPRPAPDAVEHVRRAVTRAGYGHTVRVRLTADVEAVRRRVPPAYGTATAVGPGVTDLESSADDLADPARHLTMAAYDLSATLTVLDPPELDQAIEDFTTSLAATRVRR
ncbi:helix-turn-helix transcriptional regulator [Janibacter anophelis]|uniref:helix-turn-helix transcriptional regulator n=1 Tax=Janibacter anophelis TaxID=319054 RepID=UPI000DEF76D7|nr:WYL domain-containing protein [Janibacter anophelis]